MLRYTYDPDVDCWYFDEFESQNQACRTETLYKRTVNIDYDHHGNVVGVEVV